MRRTQRISLLSMGLVLCAVTAARAQQMPKAEISLGYTYERSNVILSGGCCFNMHGGSGSVAYNLNNWFGLVGDFGAYHTGNVKDSKLDLTVVSYLFGPRLSYRKHEGFTLFGQILVGGGHSGGSLYSGPPATVSGPHHAFVATVGGGLDVKVHPKVAIRLFQAEYFVSRFKNGVNDHQNNLRLTTGIVFRLGNR